MNACSDDIAPGRHSLAIGVWENEGGAPDCADGQYGRRIEADRTWTVYHVFTGVPARADGQAMIGLSRSKATDGMVSLNRRNETRRCVERQAPDNYS